MKVRFDGLDVMAMVHHLNHVALGRRVINIYEGDSTDSYLFKLDHAGQQVASALQPSADNTTAEQADKEREKLLLFLESGVRFHTTSAAMTAGGTAGSNTNNKPLSPFVSQLRKHLRGLRLEQVTQLGHGDRVVHFVFGMGEQRRALLLELYAKGNIVLCDNSYTIVALLRSHQYTNNSIKEEGSNDDGAVQVKVGHVYPVTYAARSIITASSSLEEKDDKQNDQDVSVTTLSSADEWRSWAERQVDALHHHHQLQQAKAAATAEVAEESNPSVAPAAAAPPPTNKKGGGRPQPKKKKKGNKGGEKQLTLKTLLLKPTSGVSHYGPNFLEHCLLKAHLPPHQALMINTSNDANETDTTTTTITISGMPSMEQWEALIKVLREESAVFYDDLTSTGPSVVVTAGAAPPKGYILYSQKAKTNEETTNQADDTNNDNKKTTTTDHGDKILEEFQPYLLLQQHKGRPFLEFETFNDAVDVFFGQLEAQKRLLKAQAAEVAARDRLAKIERDQQARVEQLERDVIQIQEQAEAVELNADSVEKARMVINSALDSGMDWEQLEQLVLVEQEENHNPIALLICDLELDKDAMTLELPTLAATTITDEDNEDESNSDERSQQLKGDKKVKGGGNNGNEPKRKKIKKNHVLVSIALKETAHGNASNLFAKYRAMKEKVQRTIEASTKALKAAQETAQRQLADAQKRTQQATNIALASSNTKAPWFTKFHWFITSDNYLVLGGRDAHQNEVLVKKYLRSGDAYLHADVYGAASCILRAKRIRVYSKMGGKVGGSSGTKTQIVPLSDQALREAGNFTICRSSAWASKMVTSAWWVESHQVSKTAPTGEYLKVGAFMIRGKKNYLPPTPLEMGVGVLFRLATPEGVLDPATMVRHRNERRDFALMEFLQQHEDDDYENDSVGASAVRAKKTDHVKVNDPKTEFEGPETATPGETDKPDDLNYPYGDTETQAQTGDSPGGDIADTCTSQEKLSTLSEGGAEELMLSTDFNTTSNRGNGNKNKKGLSVKERKLIKKYGSLEEAKRALEEREQEQQEEQKEQGLPPDYQEVDDDDEPGRTEERSMKRGKRGKKKRVMRKYADQDEEDRELAMLALQGGEKDKKKSKDKRVVEPTTEEQKEAAAETAALLVKDAAKAAERLPEDVKNMLAECVTVKSSSGKDGGDSAVRWDKFDADVLEQLASFPGERAAKLAAAKRLLFLKSTSRIDNFSASLAGIIRTIQKYGHRNLETDLDPDGRAKTAEGARRKTRQEKMAEEEEWKKTLKEEGVDEVAEEEDEDADLDDTAEINKFTGKPHPEDALLYALPVCAPYQTLSQYTYRIKLTPGNLKRGKASKQCVEMFLKGDGKQLGPPGSDPCRELLKKVADNDWVQVIATDVKIATAGATKTTTKQKANNNKSKNKK